MTSPTFILFKASHTGLGRDTCVHLCDLFRIPMQVTFEKWDLSMNFTYTFTTGCSTFQTHSTFFGGCQSSPFYQILSSVGVAFFMFHFLWFIFLKMSTPTEHRRFILFCFEKKLMCFHV